MTNYINKNMTLRDSVYSPRLHLEELDLHIEPGIEIESLLISKKLKINKFPDLNLFFGGVNAVTKNEAVSDPRRGGVSIEC